MRHHIVTGCVALGTMAALALLPRAVEAGPQSPGPDRALVVTSVLPRRNQEALPDLSDPGLNNRIRVRFSAWVNPRDLLDESNAVNGLSDKCDLRDHASATVAGASFVRQNVLFIDPTSAARPVLPVGRYSLTLKSSIRSLHGRLLNDGGADFKTTFYIGSDLYAPVLRRIAPRAGQSGVAPGRAVVATFDEAIDLASAEASIRLLDRSTLPPTAIPARVRLARRGMEVVVSPRSRAGFPANRDVTLVIAGKGTATDPSATLLADVQGNAFARDAGPEWVADPVVPTLFRSPNGDYDEVTGEFSVTFRTRGPGSR